MEKKTWGFLKSKIKKYIYFFIFLNSPGKNMEKKHGGFLKKHGGFFKNKIKKIYIFLFF